LAVSIEGKVAAQQSSTRQRRRPCVPVEACDRFHLVGRQLPGDRTHLLVDIVVADALCEGCQLAFDVRGVLAAAGLTIDLEAKEVVALPSLKQSCL
jgi:hypothetical protein